MKKTLNKQIKTDRIISIITYGAAFLLPALVLLLAYINLEVHPFGELSILVGDMNSQYVDYLSSFRDLLTGDTPGNIFYNWSSGGGINYFGLLTYYLISPFNVILLFFSKANITAAILLITLLKVGASGLAFYIYAKKTFNINNIISLILSLFYALSGFSVIYACNIMWLDTIILLPLFMLGLDALIMEGKITLYIVSLFGLFLTNYYLSFMVGLFAIMYFFAKVISEYGVDKDNHKPIVKAIILFAISSALTICAAGVVLLPSFYSLMDSYVGGITTGDVPFTDDIYGVLSKLFVGSYDDITYGLPNLYLGIAPLILVVLYFLNSKIKVRERVASGVVLAVFFASFLIPKLNLIWHMFRAPTWFPVRYSFLFIFFCLYLCGRCLTHWKDIKLWKVAVGGLTVFAVLFISTLHKGENLSENDIIINLVLVTVYILLMFVFTNKNTKKRAVTLALSVLLLLVSVGEVYVNSNSVISDLNDQLRYRDNATYSDFYNKYSPVTEYIEKTDDSLFYRVEHDKIRDANDSMALGVNGLSHYSSVSNQRANILYNKLGMAKGYANRYYRYTGAPGYYDSLMGVKYVMSEGERKDFGYEMRTVMDGVKVYENKYALPLVYGVPQSAEKIADKMIQGNNCFDTVNKYLKALTGINKNCFYVQDECIVDGVNNADLLYYSVSNSVEYKLKIKASGYYYFHCSNNFKEYPQVYVNGRLVSGYKDVTYKTVISLGYYKMNQTVTVLFNNVGENRRVDYACFARLYEGTYNQMFEKLKQDGIELDKTPTSSLSGKITLSKDGYIATSIPYDKGWTVKVDGKKCETFALGEGLIGVPATKGEHRVEFSFTPRGFTLGLILSLLSIVVIVLFILYLHKKNGEMYKN